MEKKLRRFETRGSRQARWCNLVVEGPKLTTFSGVVGAGSPGSWQGAGKEASRVFPTKQEATAAATAKYRELVAKGYTELCHATKTPAATSKDPLRAAWGRIETWFCHHAPARCEYPLAAAASEGDLRRVERLIGEPLPGDFRSSYRRHDGSNRIEIFDIFELGYWMPLFTPKRLKGLYRSVAAEWQSMTDLLREGGFDDIGSNHRPKGPIKREHWNEAWIPFTCSDSGDFLCIDLDPPPAGKRGQVIFWWHEWGPYTVVADSFGSLLTKLAQRLEGGIYTFELEAGMGERLGYGRAGKYSFDHLLKVFRTNGAKPPSPAGRNG